jgi:uncharacterized protein (TIGR03435 family)
LKFEVASVKQSLTPPQARDGLGVHLGPDSLTARKMTIKQFVLWAFGIKKGV